MLVLSISNGPFTTHTLISSNHTNLHTTLEPQEYAFSTIKRLCQSFEKDEETKRCMRDVIEYVMEKDMETTYVDRPRLRIQPSDGDSVDEVSDSKYGFGRFSQTLPLHRDTWGSGIAYQINWWGPLFELDKHRTLQIYPSYFEKSVQNTSSDWNYEALKRCRKSGESYPQMPVFRGDLKKVSLDAQPIVVEPGDLVLFSGAHLHSSVPNRTGLCRISTEWRTFDSCDYDSSSVKGAPNVDGTYLCGPRTEWFRNAITGKHYSKN